MGMSRQVAVLAALLTLVAGACGAESEDDPTPDDGASAPTSTGPQVSVESVTVQQSGGIAGIDQTWHVTGSTPGAEQVFAAAQDEALRDAAASKSTQICCDFFVYDIVIRFSDGDTLRLATSDAVEPDPAVKALLNAVLAMHRSTPDGGNTD